MNSGSGGLPPAAIRYGAVATGPATGDGGCFDPMEFGSPAPDARKLPAVIGHQTF